MSTCLTAEQIENLAAGAVGGSEAGAFRQHVNRCVECHERHEECRRNLAYLVEVKDALLDEDGMAEDAACVATRVLDNRSGTGPDPSSLTGDIPGYEIGKELHRGGQGVVYEAVQLATRRTVALKVMLDAQFASEKTRWRFEREVKLVASLKHPNIVVLHDSGITYGRYYFAMDHVRGKPLDEHVRQAGSSVDAIIRLFKTICEAVGYAQRRGVIHRDLKPSNIMVDEDGTPYVLDFGLAKSTGSESGASLAAEVSSVGDVVGTVPYMSPEQTMGDLDAVDTRTDVYSLGVMLYELLTGARPYKTTGVDIATALHNIREVDPPRPSKHRSEVNSEIDAIVLKCLEKEPDRRYPSADVLGEDLAAWLEGRPVSARSASSLYVLRKIAARHSFETLVVATLIISLVSFASISVHYYMTAEEAVAESAASERETADIARQVEESRPAEAKIAASSSFGWFLAEWYAKHLDRAREWQELAAVAAPAYAAAMAFLLDENVTPQQLESQLPEDHKGLFHFVVGERALQSGNEAEAQVSFELSRDLANDSWLKAASEARLDRIRSDRGLADGGPPATHATED